MKIKGPNRTKKRRKKVKLDGHAIKPNRTIRKWSNFKSLYAYGAIKLLNPGELGLEFMVDELENIDYGE